MRFAYDNAVIHGIPSITEKFGQSLNTVLEVEKSKRLMVSARKRLFGKKETVKCKCNRDS